MKSVLVLALLTSVSAFAGNPATDWPFPENPLPSTLTGYLILMSGQQGEPNCVVTSNTALVPASKKYNREAQTIAKASLMGDSLGNGGLELTLTTASGKTEHLGVMAPEVLFDSNGTKYKYQDSSRFNQYKEIVMVMQASDKGDVNYVTVTLTTNENATGSATLTCKNN